MRLRNWIMRHFPLTQSWDDEKWFFAPFIVLLFWCVLIGFFHDLIAR